MRNKHQIKAYDQYFQNPLVYKFQSGAPKRNSAVWGGGGTLASIQWQLQNIQYLQQNPPDLSVTS